MNERDVSSVVEGMLNHEDALNFLIGKLRNEPAMVASYGYDLYVSRAMDRWVDENKSRLPNPGGWISAEHFTHNIPYISEVFFAAAWELCRLGVIRPGVKRLMAQSTDDGSAGNGFSTTPFGKKWLSEAETDNPYVPTEPGRFSTMLEPYTSLFGNGFKERANQALACYGAHAYLACCVMCGAAGESILLKLAIDKKKDEEGVLKLYRQSNGRKKIEDLVLRQAAGIRKEDFESCFSLLKYWRDESAHGGISGIKENEAFTSLALLLRCAQFAKDNYKTLTG